MPTSIVNPLFNIIGNPMSQSHIHNCKSPVHYHHMYREEIKDNFTQKGVCAIQEKGERDSIDRKQQQRVATVGGRSGVGCVNSCRRQPWVADDGVVGQEQRGYLDFKVNAPVIRPPEFAHVRS
ncbi:hypothetical protein L1887_32825 [Cichorium endivia]|nr:hypothetical protein L1887_32825 [Cichorium endivia]